MPQRLLKPARVVLAIAFLVATAVLFLDLEGRAPGGAIDSALYLQFTPSLVKFAHAVGWGALGFGFVLLLTLLFGRVFCSTICPLGTLQDIVIRLAERLRRHKKRVRFRYRRPHHFLRFGLLIGAAVFAMGGSLFLIVQLDPFSQFGRIMALLVRPLVVGANNMVALTLECLGSYLVAPLKFALANWQVLLAPLGVLGLLVWMSTKHGRLFCNTLCPVGTLLGMLSRIALFRIVIDRAQCNLCAKCSVQCKAECIHPKDMRVDFDRCVACFNCIPVCPESGIGYRLAWKARVGWRGKENPTTATMCSFSPGVANVLDAEANGLRNAEPNPQSRERRAFLWRSAYGLVSCACCVSMSGATDWPQNKRPTTIPVVKQHPVAPPGSGSITRFNAACTACQLCVSVCPTQVLQPSLLSYGPSGFLQPHMDYEAAYCTYECIRCGQVCPTDAIRPMETEEKKRSRIGTAYFIEDNCIVVTEKTACGACAEHCPSQAVHMVPYEKELTVPELDADVCIGCGACEHVCPVRPHRAIYVEGELLHQVAKMPRSETLQIEVPADFPF